MYKINNTNFNDLTLCSYCKTEFIPSNLFSQTPLPLKKEDKFNQILDCILQSGLFCSKCSRYHTSIICVNSQIPFPK